MKKIKMSRGVTLTFEEGCNKYIDNYTCFVYNWQWMLNR